MKLDEAVKKFANDFSFIPTGLIIDAYKDDPEKLVCLNSADFCNDEYFDYWPCTWGTMFAPKDWTDREWIREHPEIVEECGFVIYECDHCDVLLGLNGGGYCFYDAHWKPLYLKRGLSWHD